MSDHLIPGQAVHGVSRKGVARGGYADTKYARTCEGPRCSNVFVPVYDNALYCSSACRQRAYRRRKKRAAAPKP